MTEQISLTPVIKKYSKLLFSWEFVFPYLLHDFVLTEEEFGQRLKCVTVHAK